MTLILARASAEYVLQVTDRLITSGKDGKPYDKCSNKNILYIASNAVVTLAYTGIAYLEGKPTDHWIAEKLTGLEIDPYNPPMMITYSKKGNNNIGLSFLKLTSDLNNLQSKYDISLLLTFQGWQWNSKSRLRPLVGRISKDPSKMLYQCYYEPRDWYINGSAMTISAPKENFTQDELAKLSTELRHKSAPEATRILVRKIREVSQRISVVGPYCISILIPPPSKPIITVRYHSVSQKHIQKQQQLDDNQSLWAYTPWVISHNCILPPSQVSGEGYTFSSGFFTIKFLCKTRKHPIWLMSHEGQKRRRYPK